MATTDAKTALLSEAAKHEANKAGAAVTAKYDKYEFKHGHVDNQAEKDKLDAVLDGVNDRGLRWSIMFLDKLSKIIIGVLTFTAIVCAACAALGAIDILLPRSMVSNYILINIDIVYLNMYKR